MNYKFVATVQSKSNPNKAYTIKMNDDGLLTCNCPSWIYNQRGDRTCKHVDEIRRTGFSADQKGKLIIGKGDWGRTVPVWCKNYPDNCDECKLRFVCYTELQPKFSQEQLANAGIIGNDGYYHRKL